MDQESLIDGIIAKIEEFAQENDATKVVEVKLKIGALSEIDVDDFRDEFAEVLEGTIADGARIDFELSHDPDDPDAEDIVLVNVEVV